MLLARRRSRDDQLQQRNERMLSPTTSASPTTRYTTTTSSTTTTTTNNSSSSSSINNSSSNILDFTTNTRQNSFSLETVLPGVDHRGGDGEYTNRPSNNGNSPLWPPMFVMQVTAIASLGGILFGYDLGVISGALPQLIQVFDLTNRQSEVCVSILYLGGGIGAALGGPLCDSFGRKRAILITDIIFAIGGFLLFAAPNFATIVLGRVVVGFAIAVSGIADVSYLHEIAPVQFRGAIVSVNEACISLGFLLAFGIGSALSGNGNTDGWRIMFGLSGLIALVQFAGMLSLPESPKWLEERGRHEESEIALRRINGDYALYHLKGNSNETTNAEPQGSTSAYQSTIPAAPVSSFETSNEFDDRTSAMSTYTGFTNRIGMMGCQLVYLYKQCYTFTIAITNEYRRQAYITLFLAVTQQLCGQANVLSYAPIIFANASGADAASSASYVQGWSTLSIGLVKFFVTVLVIWKIESIGRRTLLLFGIGTIAVGLLLLAAAFAGSTIDTHGDEIAAGSFNRGFLLALPGVLLVVCGYSCSFGPLTWLLTSELFPTDIRGRALGTSTIITYLCAAIVTYTFLTAQSIVGASVLFSLYLFITCLGWIFAFVAIPDTGGKNADEIKKDLDKMVCWEKSSREHTDPTSAITSPKNYSGLTPIT